MLDKLLVRATPNPPEALPQRANRQAQAVAPQNVYVYASWTAIADTVGSAVPGPMLSLAKVLHLAPPFALTTGIKKAVVKQCPVLLDGAITQFKNTLSCPSVDMVPSTAMAKPVRISLVREIGRAAASNNVALLEVFQRHGFGQQRWMGPWVMECATCCGSMAAVLFMVSESGASKGDAMLSFQKWSPQKQSQITSCDFELELIRFQASRLGNSLFSIE